MKPCSMPHIHNVIMFEWSWQALHVAVKICLHCHSADAEFRISTASSIQFDSVSSLCHMLRIGSVHVHVTHTRTHSNEQHAMAAPQLISCFNTNDATSSSAKTQRSAYAVNLSRIAVVVGST